MTFSRRNSSQTLLEATLFLLLWLAPFAAGFHPLSPSSAFAATRTSRESVRLAGATTVEPPTRERTDRKTGSAPEESYDYGEGENDEDNFKDLEYLIDSRDAREMDDPFHILLMGETFDNPRVTVPYAATSLEYVLSMPRLEAVEQAKFAKDQGMSCLGTWNREECLSLGRQLQMRDLECRVVPYCEGGQRGWQAKDMSSSNSNSGSSSGGSAGFE